LALLRTTLLKSGSEFGQFIACRSPFRIGTACGQILVSNRLIELARREVIPLTFDAIVKMVAGRQRRPQQLAAEELVNQQRGDVALPCRRIARRPLTGVANDQALRNAL
jgi:hypothetical protein